MKKLLALTCLAFTAFAAADDPSLRAAFQSKYDSVNSAIKAGDLHAVAGLCDSRKFVATDIQKQHQSLGQFLKGFDQKGLEVSTHVESADTLNGMAKTALRVALTRNADEKGKTVRYKTVKTEEDTWEQV